MKAINWSSYEQFGCIGCGSNNCYVKWADSPLISMILICKECNKEFITIKDGFNLSPIGIPKERYRGSIIDGNEAKFEVAQKLNNENGIAIIINGYAYPIPQEHPRRDILIKCKK